MLDGVSRRERVRHDLAHLLSCILLASDTLEHDLNLLSNDTLPPELRDEVEQLRGSSAILTHAGRMAVHVLADLNEADPAPQTAAVVPLMSVVSRATYAIRPLLWSDVELSVNVEPDIHLYGSGEDLATVLFNLLLNAAEALRSAEPNVAWIALRAHRMNGQVVVDVSDSGPGMPDQGPAFGTGLAICRRLMRQMGGGMEFLSAHGGGAVARLRLPAAPAPTTP